MSLSWLWYKFVKVIGGKSIKKSSISKRAFINYGSVVYNSEMNDYSYCGYDCWIIDANIGKYCSISNNVKIGGPSHPLDWISTSPVFHSQKNILKKYYENEGVFNPFTKTIIENDVWIGECSIIKAGVKISNGAVIGAGSVVTKDVPPFEIWAGNPAKFIRKRFDDETIARILKPPRQVRAPWR